jgi:hypothetical protein
MVDEIICYTAINYSDKNHCIQEVVKYEGGRKKCNKRIYNNMKVIDLINVLLTLK